MDHELKQRLIGAVVVTALCAIFIPMLFDDPVDNSGQLVSELNIPAPVDAGANTASKVPANAEQVAKLPDSEPLSTETTGDTIESTGAPEEIIEEPAAGQSKQGRSEESLYTESEGYTREDAGAEEAVEPDDSQPKLRPKQPPVEQPLAADAAADTIRKSMVAKVPVRESHVETMAKEPVKIKKAVEPIKLPVKKPEVESTATAISDAVRQPSSNAKSLAAAVAEAKKPAVVPPKANQKLVRWYIQLGSFSKKENAMSLWESLHEQGLPASLDTVQTDKGISYRLRLGPELDGKKAAAMKSRLDKQNIKAILISE